MRSILKAIFGKPVASTDDLLVATQPKADEAAFEAVSFSPLKRPPSGEWEGAKTHYGGNPNLGEAPWPCHPHDGRPLHMAMQIDLEDIASILPDSLLPKNGTLIFFVETDLEDRAGLLGYPKIGGAVVHAPPQAGKVKAPQKASPIYGKSWDYYQRAYYQDKDVPRSFPYWPVRVDRVEMTPTTIHDVWRSEIGCHFGNNLSARDLPLPAVEGAFTWGMAQLLFGEFLRVVLPYKGKDASEYLGLTDDFWVGYFEQVEPTATDWVKRAQSFSANEPMSESELHEMRQDVARCMLLMNQSGKMLLRRFFQWAHRDAADPLNVLIDRACEEVMRAKYAQMYLGSSEDYAALPQSVRDFYAVTRSFDDGGLVTDTRLLGWVPSDFAFGNKILLLQLASQGSFVWEDLSNIRYWIEPTDLAAGRFENVVVTVEAL